MTTSGSSGCWVGCGVRYDVAGFAHLAPTRPRAVWTQKFGAEESRCFLPKVSGCIDTCPNTRGYVQPHVLPCVRFPIACPEGSLCRSSSAWTIEAEEGRLYALTTYAGYMVRALGGSRKQGPGHLVRSERYRLCVELGPSCWFRLGRRRERRRERLIWRGLRQTVALPSRLPDGTRISQ